ncbi:MAG: RecX family transcriptional regulator [Saprospiraceae bacterium]|nr:RecX family transcriptional regulator [Saprospiraceae bacterium]
MSKKPVSFDKALSKLQMFCSYRERCHLEVRLKLWDLGIYEEERDAIISKLIEDDFLNEMRYAIAYVGGKFRTKGWGKIRIVTELKKNKISDYCIKKAIQTEMPEKVYQEKLHHVLRKKAGTLKETSSYIRNQKLVRFALYKGFEIDQIYRMLNENQY